MDVLLPNVAMMMQQMETDLDGGARVPQIANGSDEEMGVKARQRGSDKGGSVGASGASGASGADTWRQVSNLSSSHADEADLEYSVSSSQLRRGYSLPSGGTWQSKTSTISSSISSSSSNSNIKTTTASNSFSNIADDNGEYMEVMRQTTLFKKLGSQ